MEKFIRSTDQCILCACYIENVSGEVRKEMDRCDNECTYGLFISKALLPCPVFRVKKGANAVMTAFESPVRPTSLLKKN